MISIRQVLADEDVRAVAALARRIWTRHYVPIIGSAQTEYMLETIQSESAIVRQLAEGCEYFLAMDGEDPAGYCAWIPDPSAGRAKLSKLYVLPERQGQGIGKRMIGFLEERCAGLEIREIWLTVNRHNAQALSFYHGRGFLADGAVVQDIGGGFVMDDYRMVKRLG